VVDREPTDVAWRRPIAGDIREQISELPSYGYRAPARWSIANAPALVHACEPQARVPVMAATPCCCRRRRDARSRAGRTPARVGPGHDTRWCSDGFEIKCDSGQTVTATFAKDCCDREIMAFRAWEGKGCRASRCARCSSRPWRSASAPWRPCLRAISFSSCGQRRRLHRARDQAHRQVAGLTPVNTPVCSPQSNGMAESFVNTLARLRQPHDLSDARTPGAVARAFEHFNEVHPHSSLKMKSPREFRRQR